MNKKKLLTLIMIGAAVAVVLYFTLNKKADPKNGVPSLDIDGVNFTFTNESGESESLGWKAYVDRFYTSGGSKASERVQIRIQTMMKNQVWVNKIIDMAPAWGMTPAKKLVYDAILGTVDLGHITPKPGTIPSLKSYSQAKGVVFT